MKKRVVAFGLVAMTGLAGCGMARSLIVSDGSLAAQQTNQGYTDPGMAAGYGSTHGAGYGMGTGYGTGYTDPSMGAGYGSSYGSGYGSATGYGSGSGTVYPTSPGTGYGQTYPTTNYPTPYPQLILPSTQPSILPGRTPALELSPNPYRENFFRNYGTNPFVETNTDPLSTFALDVDTGAYSFGRSELNASRLPNKDSVRTEEYLNAFNYAYPQPTTGALAIHTELAPSYFGEPETQLLRIGVQAREILDRQRTDATLTLVVDVSGSMNEGNRLELVKQGIRHLLDRLRPSDRVGIVAYSSEARVLLEHTRAAEKSTILSIVDSLRPEGSTNAAAGLMLAYSKASGVINSGGINRVMLFSDGVANQGETSPDELMKTIKRQSESGILLTTLGVGRNGFNDTLMEQLANQGDGAYAYIDNLTEAKRVLGSDLTSTLQTVAKDAKIQVVFNKEIVEQYRLLGYENRNVADKDFRNDAVDAGEIGANHSVTGLYEVRYKSGVTSGEVAKVVLRYKDLADAGRVQEISRPVNVSDLTSFKNATPSFKLATAVAEYSEILRQSVFARDGKLSEVANLAQTVQTQLPNDPQLNEFVTLVAKASQLQNPIRLQSHTDLLSTSQNPQALPEWQSYLLRQLGG